MPNSWRIVVSCMEIWPAATEGDMIKVDELVYLYHLKEFKEHEYYELVPWDRRTRIVRDLPSSFRYWKSCFFFVSGDEWKTPSSEVWGDLPRLLRQWRTPSLGASLFLLALYSLFILVHSLVANSYVPCAVKRRPKLKSRYKQRVEAAIEYAKSIDDFDDLVNSRTLALYCLGPEPFAYVLHTIEREEKKSISFSSSFLFFFFYARMTTKFNQDMYAKMRSKKNEPLSNLGKRTVHVIGKGPPITPTILVAPAVPNTETTRTASSATSVEEITTPVSKRLCLTDKGKEKVDSCSSRIWDDVELVVEKAYEVVTTEDLKVFSSTPSNKVMACHVHKLVQVTYLCNFIPFFLFSFFIVLKAPIFFSSAGEESSHHLGVPHLGSQGRVCDVQDGGFGGEELQTKERPNCHYRRGQHH